MHTRNLLARGCVTIWALTSFAALSAAVCTEWAQITTETESDSNWSTRFSEKVDQQKCPETATTRCKFAGPKKYHVTIEPRLITNVTHLGLDSQERDAIFRLAADEYSKATNSTSRTAFVKLEGSVNTEELFATDSPILKFDPGFNTSLLFVPYMKTSIGKLRGCTNASLNGLQVSAAAPYLQRDSKSNESIIAGTWGSQGERSVPVQPSTTPATSPVTTSSPRPTSGTYKQMNATGIWAWWVPLALAWSAYCL